MSEQLSERGKDLVKYMPQAVNDLADRLIEKLGERLFYGEKQQTNADRIRSMSDEELAEFISGKARTFGEEYEGYMSALDWLKEECKT